MKAVICKRHGLPDTLVIEDLPSPQAGSGQVVISVKAAGVNFPDVLIIQDKYQFKPPLPFSPGSEVAGTIKAVGEGVTGLKPGDAVMALLNWGGYAEEVAVEAGRVAPIPKGLALDVAASFGITYVTSYHALKDRARIAPGESLLVLGAAGGVGLATVELGKLMGARVIAAASSADKLATCKRHGADELINYEQEDLREAVKRLTAGKGVDVVYDPVGGKFSEPALRSMAWNGRHLVVGFAAGDIARIPLNLALLKGCSIVGVFSGGFANHEPEKNRANLAEIARLLEQGKLKPLVSASYPLERAAEALNQMMNRKVQGKAVLVTA